MNLTHFDVRLYRFIQDVWQDERSIELYAHEIATFMRINENEVIAGMDRLFKVQVSIKITLDGQIVVCEKPLIIGKKIQTEDGLLYRLGTIEYIDWEDFELGLCD